MFKAVIEKIIEGSLAEELELQKGDIIHSVNGNKPKDIIDFQFLWSDIYIELEIERADETFIIEFEKEMDEPLGVVFASAVFDKLRTCRNKCLFCFVDQMPFGLRESLYQKDDDYRLSVLQGSFVTLTNLSDEDLKRIISLHLSPLYVSVHTTNPELRVRLLKNPRAALIKDMLNKLAQNGIEFHTQIVLCPGINDGEFLNQSIIDLVNMWPECKSLAIVPVGITRFRDKLEPINTFSKEEAQALIKEISLLQEEYKKKLGYSFIWLSDEFYITADMDLPNTEVYEDFPQLENGVGMTALFRQQFFESEHLLPQKLSKNEKFYLVAGISGEKGIRPIVQRLNQIENLEIVVKTLENDFFGSSVTVSGLLTGHDLLRGLKGLEEGARVLIPAVMLRTYENKFLDDCAIEDVEKELKIKLIPVEIDGLKLIEAILPIKEERE